MVQSGRRARPNPKAQDEQAQVIERKEESIPSNFIIPTRVTKSEAQHQSS